MGEKKEKRVIEVCLFCAAQYVFDLPVGRTFLIMCTAGKNVVEWYLLLLLHHGPTTVASADCSCSTQHLPSSPAKLMM